MQSEAHDSLKGCVGIYQLDPIWAQKKRKLLTDSFHKLLCWVSALLYSTLSHASADTCGITCWHSVLRLSCWCLSFCVLNSDGPNWNHVMGFCPRCIGQNGADVTKHQARVKQNECFECAHISVTWGGVVCCWTSNLQVLPQQHLLFGGQRSDADLAELTVTMCQVRWNTFLSFTFLGHFLN